MNKKLKIIINVFIIIVIIFLIAWPKLDLLEADDQNKGNAQQTQNVKTPVEAVIVKTRRLENNIQVNGSVMANESVELSSEAAGKITQINFREGERVRKGALLIKINNNELQARLKQARHNLELLEKREFREQKLLEREAISQEEYDGTLTELKNARAQIELLEARIEKTEIRAPFDGIIGLRYISEGSYISPNTQIASLYNINPVKIAFSIPAKYSNHVKSGTKINFTSDALNQDTLQGEIYAIEPKVDADTRTLKMRAYAENKRQRLLPGHFLTVQLILNSTDNAIMVPTQAVVPTVDGHKIFVNNKGKVNSKQVRVGTRTNMEVEIEEGLSPSDTVIVTGVQQIQDGTSIEITSFN